VAGFAEWQMAPAVAAGLEQLGWSSDEGAVRDVVPPTLRGGNLVAVLPPAPAWATPILAGLLGRHEPPSGAVLVLAAPAQLAEWALAAGALVEGTALQVDVAMTLPGASRPIDLLIASPESALERHARSALDPGQFRAVVFAWPEEWQADDAVTALLQDIPRDAQRVVLTARRDQVDGAGGVVERYARKALVVSGPAVEGDASRAPSVRTIASSWAGRAGSVAAALAGINSSQASIWTADRRDHQLIRRTLGSLPESVALVSRAVPAAGSIICYDPPSPQQLATLGAVGEVVLLVAPGNEGYTARIAPSRRPMTQAAPAAAAMRRDDTLRAEIGRAIAGADEGAGLYVLAPLFEAHDPQLVAAALFALWRGASRPAAGVPAGAEAPPRVHAGTIAPAREAAPSGPGAVAKIWIGAGKKDDATVADFVAVLVREVGVERSRIGRIELRDTFALVEVPAADAEAIVARLSGITIRKRKLTARVDQGRGGGKQRG
jgi:ATP-dependent RNA helicase DeaD